MLVFLDIDGVLRPLGSPPDKLDPDCLDCFETAIIDLPGARIVISSTWRLAYGLREIKARFSGQVAERIIGVTPEADTLARHHRHAEVIKFLRQSGQPDATWVAIDDDPELFAAQANVIITDPHIGFNEQDANRLHLMASRLQLPK